MSSDRISLAGCILLDPDDRILLLHRNTPKRVQWEIPGGKQDEGETLDQVAVRELLEELGVDIEIVRRLGGRHFDEDTYTMEYTWFLGRIVGGEPAIQEPHTHDEWRYFTAAELGPMHTELSANTTNFLEELAAGNIDLSGA